MVWDGIACPQVILLAKSAGNEAIAERVRAAGERARREAQARRERAQSRAPVVKEIGGPAAPEPTRYGDWERKGIASDF
jgi:hypothetical protein